jgi:hypothetical protein
MSCIICQLRKSWFPNFLKGKLNSIFYRRITIFFIVHVHYINNLIKKIMHCKILLKLYLWNFVVCGVEWSGSLPKLPSNTQHISCNCDYILNPRTRTIGNPANTRPLAQGWLSLARVCLSQGWASGGTAPSRCQPWARWAITGRVQNWPGWRCGPVVKCQLWGILKPLLIQTGSPGQHV